MAKPSADIFHTVVVLLVALVIGTTGLHAEETPPPPQPTAPPLENILDQSFGRNALWDDGQAEVAAYDAVRMMYGLERPHIFRLITVYEDFNREFYTKADWPYGQKPILPVIKQNQIATIPTPNYDYQFMTSVFSERQTFGRTVKITIGSQEWCGQTFKEMLLTGEKPRMTFHSYWDGEGTGVYELRADPSLFWEEELFLVLRALPFTEGLTASFFLYQNQTTNRAPEPRASSALLSVSRGNNEWTVDVRTRDERRIRYAFGSEYPHPLLEFEHSDGRRMELRSLERYDYWTFSE